MLISYQMMSCTRLIGSSEFEGRLLEMEAWKRERSRCWTTGDALH